MKLNAMTLGHHISFGPLDNQFTVMFLPRLLLSHHHSFIKDIVKNAGAVCVPLNLAKKDTKNLPD